MLPVDQWTDTASSRIAYPRLKNQWGAGNSVSNNALATITKVTAVGFAMCKELIDNTLTSNNKQFTIV